VLPSFPMDANVCIGPVPRSLPGSMCVHGFQVRSMVTSGSKSKEASTPIAYASCSLNTGTYGVLWAIARDARPKSKPRVSAIVYLCLSTSCSWWRLRTRSPSLVWSRPALGCGTPPLHLSTSPSCTRAVSGDTTSPHHAARLCVATRRRTRYCHRRVERHVIPSEKHGGASYGPERVQGATYATSSGRISSVVIPMPLGSSGSWRCATRSRLLGLMEAVSPPQRSSGMTPAC
jgi:hypothetical protein